jgi:aryl-alcohol dehydrogenase-like predicted oxidoreductase
VSETDTHLVPFSPLGKGFLTGKINEDTKVDDTDFRNTVPRFNPENCKPNQALVDLLGKIRGTEEGDTCSARTCLAACKEAVGRSHSGHDKAASP